MKKVLLLTVAIMMVASMANAQGRIALYTDLGTFADCNVEADAGLLNIYVVHELSLGATASQYKIDNGTTGFIYLADVNLFALVIGNSQAGVAVSYGACLGSPIHVQTILYQGLGIAPACSQLSVVPDPAAPSGNIEAVDCAAIKEFPSGGVLTVKDDGSCPCVVAVEETTWGQLKSLYE